MQRCIQNDARRQSIMNEQIFHILRRSALRQRSSYRQLYNSPHGWCRISDYPTTSHQHMARDKRAPECMGRRLQTTTTCTATFPMHGPRNQNQHQYGDRDSFADKRTSRGQNTLARLDICNQMTKTKAINEWRSAVRN